MSDEVLSSDELADWLGVSVDTVTYEARRGRLPGRKVGKEWRFSKQAILEWLKLQEPTGKWSDLEEPDDGEPPLVRLDDLTEALRRAAENSLRNTKSRRG